MTQNKKSLSELFRQHSIHPNSELGQNFLIDPNFLKYIVNSGDFRKDDFILEIGSGPGILTNLLATRVSKIWAIEIDDGLFAISTNLFGHLNNVRFIKNSILNKRRDGLNPDVLSAIAEDTDKPIKIISNLPYKTAVPIIMALLESSLKIATMFLMVQKEIAQRLTAVCSQGDYGALSILCSYLARIKILRQVPPDVFWPRPKVYSTFISIVPDNRLLLPKEQYFLFKNFLKGVFTYARKTIRQSLLKINGDDKTPRRVIADKLLSGSRKLPTVKSPSAQIEKILSLSKIETSRRPRQILPEEYLELFKHYGEWRTQCE